MLHWIKNHPAQSAVVALSLSLAASTVTLYFEASALPHSFARAEMRADEADPVPALDDTRVERGLAAAKDPSTWEARTRLFASRRFVKIGSELQTPEGKVFHPPVPNDWLLAHGLDPLDAGVLEADPDKDGFTTLHEWNGLDGVSHLTMSGEEVRGVTGEALRVDSTNPVEAKSHPPYHTRLAVEAIEQIPFRLKFVMADEAHDGTVMVQINPLSGRSEFVPVGSALKYSPFDVQSYEKKTIVQADGTPKDVSEVVVLDRRTGNTVTLPRGEVVSSPESYIVLRYEWRAPDAALKTPAQTFRLRKGQTFSLPPEDAIYRVGSIRAEAVEILLPWGEVATLSAPAGAKK